MDAKISLEAQADSAKLSEQQTDTKKPTLKATETTETSEKTDLSDDYIIFNEEDVAACCNAFWLMFKANYPDLELLTESEKASLGRLWLPFFKKYLSENWKIIGIPFFATTGLLLPKLAKARKIKSEKKEKEKTKDKVGKLTCKYCDQIFSSSELKKHEESCTKK